MNLRPDPKNANKGTSRGRAAVQNSLRLYGAGRSIVADKNGTVIAGNKTLDAARDAGIPVKEVHTNGEELVVVVRDDMNLETDASARELAYADNRAAELDLAWDDERLQKDLKAGVDLGKFWNELELGELLDAEKPKDEDEEAELTGGPPKMELQPLEGYDYVLVLAKSGMDFKALCEALEIGPARFVPHGMKRAEDMIGLGRCVDAKRVLARLKK